MYLSELMSSSYLTKSPPTVDEIVLIPAHATPEIEHAMVIARSDFEGILVKFRASEPASEAVLMAIGTAKGEDPSVWQALLATEFVTSHYVNLTSEFYAKELDALEFGEAASPVVEEDEVAEQTVEAVEEELVAVVEETAAAVMKAPGPSEIIPEEVPVEVSEPTVPVVALEPEVPAEVSEPEVPVVAEEPPVVEASPQSDIADADDLPEGYVSPEQQSVADAARQEEIFKQLQAVTNLVTEFRSVVLEYGLGVVMSSVGLTDVGFLSQMAENSASVRSMVNRCPSLLAVYENIGLDEILDSVRLECERLVNEGDMDKVNLILTPIIKILYEE